MDTPNPAPSQDASLQAQVDNLRATLKFTNYLGFGLAVALGLLLYRIDQVQVRNVAAGDLPTRKLQEDMDRMSRMVAELQKYAASHPDYAEVLKKYGVSPSSGTNAPAAPAAPAPAKR